MPIIKDYCGGLVEIEEIKHHLHEKNNYCKYLNRIKSKCVRKYIALLFRLRCFNICTKLNLSYSNSLMNENYNDAMYFMIKKINSYKKYPGVIFILLDSRVMEV